LTAELLSATDLAEQVVEFGKSSFTSIVESDILKLQPTALETEDDESEEQDTGDEPNAS
jgi:hypothetical protein